MLYKSENRRSREGYMIPLNYNDGMISRRGEHHLCPKNIRMPQKPTTTTVNEEPDKFMWHKAVLGIDGYWYLKHGDKLIKRLEKARLEELQSWDPNSPDGVDHSRDGTIHT